MTTAPGTKASAAVSRPVLRRAVAWCAWLYLTALLGAWLLLRACGDRWWPATLLLFGPRWFLLLPLALLAPAVAALRPRLLWPLAAALLVGLGPVLGLCLPWRPWLAGPPRGPLVRVLTCNTQGRSLDGDALGRFLEEAGPEIVVLQELTPGHERAVFRRPGWQVHREGGTCVASRYPLRSDGILSVAGKKDLTAAVRCVAETPWGAVRVVSLHLPTPREGLQPVLDRGWAGVPELRASTERRWQESERISRWVSQAGGPLLLAGDFNMPTDSTIYARHWSGFANAFSEAGLGWGSTKFTRWFGARIDHVLAGPGWQFRRCWVGPDVGSDHRPVVADAEWLGRLD